MSTQQPPLTIEEQLKAAQKEIRRLRRILKEENIEHDANARRANKLLLKAVKGVRLN